MLSILIPIYNFSVVKLVQTLRQQCIHANINFEIICFDDQSSRKFKKENQLVGSLFGVSYLELSENLGRAKIRNWLAKSANHPYLLFMDCDSEVPADNYIKNFLAQTDTTKKVVCGGRIYTIKPPRSKKRRLHWKYGSQREQLSCHIRNKSPYLSFHTNNFLIHRSVFEKIKFDEEIKGYGYEDLMYAFELKKHHIPIYHIDNPLLHLGIETTEEYLKKTKVALKNLLFLHKKNPAFNIKLIDRFYMLKKYGLLFFAKKYLDLNKAKIESSLYSENPNLKYFDLFRLNHFVQLYEENEKQNGTEKIQ